MCPYAFLWMLMGLDGSFSVLNDLDLHVSVCVYIDSNGSLLVLIGR